MDYKVGYGKPPFEHQFKPGNKASPGRPPNTLRECLRKLIYEEEPERLTGIIRETADKAVRRTDKDQMSALNLVWERLDGKVAEKHEIKALIVNVDNEYAIQLLKECHTELEEAQQQFLLTGVKDAIKQGTE